MRLVGGLLCAGYRTAVRKGIALTIFLVKGARMGLKLSRFGSIHHVFIHERTELLQMGMIKFAVDYSVKFSRNLR